MGKNLSVDKYIMKKYNIVMRKKLFGVINYPIHKNEFGGVRTWKK